MHSLYAFVSGPLTLLAFAVFIVGSLIRILLFVKISRAMDPAVYDNFQPGWALRSIFHWLFPFNATAKVSPWVTLAGFLFHGPMLVVAVFLSAHGVLWEEAWGVSWPTLPDALADVLTLVALAAALFFAVRRLTVPHVKALTTAGDWAVWAIAVLPLATGLAAYHQWFHYPTMMVLHILSADLLLVAIPFTKLSHMFLFFISRAVTGSDFGKRRVGAW